MEDIKTDVTELIENHPTDTTPVNDDEELYEIYKALKIDKVYMSHNLKVPKSFNGKYIWRDYLTPSIDQGKCGSCWAFAAVSSLADRFNIQSKGKLKVELSPSRLLLCYNAPYKDQVSDDKMQLDVNVEGVTNYSCTGNSLLNACIYLYKRGTTEEKCTPYKETIKGQITYSKLSSFSNSSKIPFCTDVTGESKDMCTDYTLDVKNGVENGTPARFYRAKNIYTINTEEDIMQDVYKFGPIATVMVVYEDFYTWDTKGIYIWDGKSEKVKGHAVVIVGWGEENNTKYWIVRNTWGRKWGQDGYFRILRGSNHCGIEDNTIGMIPDFFYPMSYSPFDYKTKSKYGSQLIEDYLDNVYTGGGIDPTVGYSFRVMMLYPHLDIKPPINYKKLSDWENFIAGKIKSKKKIKSLKKENNYSVLNISILILFLIFIFLYLKN